MSLPAVTFGGSRNIFEGYVEALLQGEAMLKLMREEQGAAALRDLRLNFQLALQSKES